MKPKLGAQSGLLLYEPLKGSAHLGESLYRILKVFRKKKAYGLMILSALALSFGLSVYSLWWPLPKEALLPVSLSLCAL